MRNIAELQSHLMSIQDLEYRAFQSKLMPTIPKQKIIGIRTPLLRQLAKKIRHTDLATEFLSTLPHRYYEEDNLHAFLIEQISNFEDCIAALERFLPYIDNWATCDSLSPPILRAHHSQLLPCLSQWLNSSHPYTIRFAIKMLMNEFLEEDFSPSYLLTVASVKSDEYYVNMMVAWYFATALAKQYKATLPYLESNRLSDWIHTKTIRKALESYRIPTEHKFYLRTLAKNCTRTTTDPSL